MIRALRLCAAALAAVLTLTACDFSVYSLPLPGGADVGDNSYAVKVEFQDVLDLVPQSAVKVDDVTVGKVEEVSLVDYTAVVEIRLHGDVKLPDNTFATIRQTSLLGEKFVSLAPPTDEPATGRLGDGDTIRLSHSGRNPEVEEVLGALSLLLNGGGVAQLKTIAAELNNALEGNEPAIKSVLSQLGHFMGQLDQHKTDIVSAIESINRLTIEVKRQQKSIIGALDELPEALQVLNQQRTGLKKMLLGLQELSPIAIDVITASKQDTLANLRALDPILTQLGSIGSDLPRSMQTFLTYPFVDASVGTTVAEARNLHQGDYTNLSVQLDVHLREQGDGPTLPTLPTAPLPTLPTLPTVSLPTVTVPGGPTITAPTVGGTNSCALIVVCRPGMGPTTTQSAPEHRNDLALLLLQGVLR
jgi:phospholipid/cholesterol/gamma-HCH transport system substrate-binding protein